MVPLIALAAALTSAPPPTPPPALVAALPACDGQLIISLDGEGGQFDGMSHSGALLILRNGGSAACKAPRLPTLQFQDADGQPLAVGRRSPPGMHPGPVVPPIAIAAGAEATAALRWVSGDVYDGHHCVTPAKVVVSAGGDPFTLHAAGQMCGPPGQSIPYDQPGLATDPVLTWSATGRP